MRRSFLGLAACCGLLVAAGAQASIPTLYHPQTGLVDPGAVVPSYPAAARTLNLVLHPGAIPNTSGTVCDSGNGDNACGLYVEIDVGGDLTIAGPSSFTSFISGQMSSNVVGNKKLRIAIVTTASPLSPVPVLLGTLQVQSGTNGGAVLLSRLQTVDASLDLMNGAPRPLAFLPEPGFGSGLVASALALALLARRHARRGGVR
ncbi:MAG TPA: hypothetical protein VNF72_15995 [Myxococcota bacterium]|nr:hypothetical protein [Myxococcota bacterium]